MTLNYSAEAGQAAAQVGLHVESGVQGIVWSASALAHLTEHGITELAPLPSDEGTELR